MSIFSRIKTVKQHVLNLKNQIPYIKNQNKLDKHIALINDVILLINDVEFMVDHKISGSVVDKLILSNIYAIIRRNGIKNNIDIHQIVDEINSIIKHPVAKQMDLLTEIFIDMQTNRILSKVKFTQDLDGFNKLNDNVTDKEVYAIADELKHQTSPAAYEILLSNLVQQFKVKAKWN